MYSLFRTKMRYEAGVRYIFLFFFYFITIINNCVNGFDSIRIARNSDHYVSCSYHI